MINGVWDTVWVNSTVRSSASGMEQAFWIVARPNIVISLTIPARASSVIAFTTIDSRPPFCPL